MRKTTGFTQLQLTLLAALAMSVSGVSWAQQPPSASGSSAPTSAAPAPRESPRPDQLEPGVNTSAPADNSSTPASMPSPGATRSPAATSGAAAGNNAQAATPSDANAPKAAGSKAARKGAGTSGGKGSAGGSPDATADGAAQTASAAAPKTGASGKAQDRIELDTTQITGNRELPKVLYIVPWKRSDLGDLAGKPVNSLLDEVLAPVDRDVFRRENRYYEALKPDQGGGATAGAGAPAGSGEKR